MRLFGRKKRAREQKATENHRERILAALKEDAESAGVFADFMCEAVNRGYAFRVQVEVDGVTCKSGIVFLGGEFAEYLANWACAQKITKGIKARKFEMQGREGISTVGEYMSNANGANLGGPDRNGNYGTDGKGGPESPI